MSEAPIYLLEGADGTGKTTFAEHMVDYLLLQGYPDVAFIHNGPEDAKLPGSLYHHSRAQLLDAVARRAAGIPTIIDRTFLSELVYGQLYRGKSRITPRQARRLERLAQRAGMVLIARTADLAIRRQRILARGESWDPTQAFVGAFYFQWFHEREDYWIIADSSSASVTN